MLIYTAFKLVLYSFKFKLLYISLKRVEVSFDYFFLLAISFAILLKISRLVYTFRYLK